MSPKNHLLKELGKNKSVQLMLKTLSVPTLYFFSHEVGADKPTVRKTEMQTLTMTPEVQNHLMDMLQRIRGKVSHSLTNSCKCNVRDALTFKKNIKIKNI